MINKIDLIITLSIFIVMYAVFIIVYIIYTVRENRKNSPVYPGKKKRKLKKTDYEDKIKRLHENISQLEDIEIKLNNRIDELRSLIYAIKFLHINLNELEELGLQRYNAKYGEVKHNNTYYGEITTFVSEELYNELSKFFTRSYTVGLHSYSRGIKHEKNYKDL